MHKPRPIPALILGAALLPACSAIAPESKMQLTVKPHEVARNTPGASIDHYQLGRQYQASGRAGLAMESYLRALKLNHQHAAARSALAELYAQEGRLAEAERVLREIITQSPSSAYLHNNLGYLHYLQGNHVAAIRDLRSALALEPSHEWARNNLKLAEAALERRMAENTPSETPSRAVTTAAALEVWNTSRRLDQAMEGTPGGTGAVAARSASDRGRIPVDPGVVEQVLRHHAPVKAPVQALSRAAQPASKLQAPLASAGQLVVSKPVASPAGTPYRLEVSNGNGITGFAKRVSQVLVRQGIPVHNLTNEPPYQQATTEIQYTAGFEQEAQRIMGSLRGYAIVTPTSATRYRTEVRVVLGRDISTRLTEIEAEKPSMVATVRPGPEQL